jgi:23S rRNA pseudouridine955/2504/2580 synthase
MKEITVQKNDAGQRLDKFLIKSFGMPSSLVYKYLRKKRIRLDGVRAKGAEMLGEGSVLTLYINDEFFEHKRETVAYEGEVNIVYEDAQIAVLYKEEGLLSHAPSGDSLAARWVAHLTKTGEYDPANERSFVPALCNRLDRNTKGLVIAAKTAAALREMDEHIRERRVKKYYVCTVLGAPATDEGELTAYLSKDEKTNTVTVSDAPHKGARPIRTGYRVLERGKRSRVEVELHTGRPHQIRAAFAHAGFPLSGDAKYGGGKGGYDLCAYKVVFDFTGGLICSGKTIELKR